MSFNFANDITKINKIVIASESEFKNYLNILKMSINLYPNLATTTNMVPANSFNISETLNVSFDAYIYSYKQNNELLSSLTKAISAENGQHLLNKSDAFYNDNINIFNCLMDMASSQKTELLNLRDKYIYISDILKSISSNNLSISYVYFKNQIILECKDKDYNSDVDFDDKEADSDILIKSLNELLNKIFFERQNLHNVYVGNSKLKYKNNVVKNIVFCLICPVVDITQNRIKSKINIMDEIGMFYCSYDPYDPYDSYNSYIIN
jgi:hypothetical protein